MSARPNWLDDTFAEEIQAEFARLGVRVEWDTRDRVGFDDFAGPEDYEPLSDAELESVEAQDIRNEGDE